MTFYEVGTIALVAVLATLATAAIYVGLLIYVTASLDHPYWGTVSIGPDDFKTLLEQVMK